MCQIAIHIPNEVLFDTRVSEEEAKRFARYAVALGYYTQSGVSIGYCTLRNWVIEYFERIISGDFDSNCCVSGGYSIEGFGLYANY